LTPLIHALGVGPDGETEQELRFARRVLTVAALMRLDELAATEDMPPAVVADQREHLEQRLARLHRSTDGGESRDGAGQIDAWTAARRYLSYRIRARSTTRSCAAWNATWIWKSSN
jgi:hypothetical protein